MKKGIVSAIAMGLALGVGSAAADDLEFNLSAEVDEVCMVGNAAGSPIDIDFGDLSNTPANDWVESNGVQAFYVCNVAAGFERTISSANGGKLLRDGTIDGDGNEIPFEMEHGGGSGLNFDYQSLSSDRNDTLSGSEAFLNGQGGTVHFRVQGVQTTSPGNSAFDTTTVFAGDYSDTVTISVNAN